MIDWLTLRTPLNFMMHDDLLEKVQHYIGEMRVFDGEGELVRTKLVFDVDRLKSDEVGLFWQIQYSGLDVYMVIGASPASVEYGGNAFGSSDVKYCANVLVTAAEKILGIKLPNLQHWDCRRIDITENYLLDSNSQVKQALRELRNGDGVRQKASVKGDSVYYGEGSDLISGKIYDKGTQVIHLMKRLHRLCKTPIYTPEQVSILDRILRMELTLRRRWFDRLQNKLTISDFHTPEQYLDYIRHNKAWLELTEDDLTALHTKYFSQFIGNIEVTDMTTLMKRLDEVAPSHGRALAAHQTWALIKAIGYEQTRDSMPRSTFARHRKYLLAAGLSHADLQTSNIIAFRRKTITISQPVRSWSELLKAA